MEFFSRYILLERMLSMCASSAGKRESDNNRIEHVSGQAAEDGVLAGAVHPKRYVS